MKNKETVTEFLALHKQVHCGAICNHFKCPKQRNPYIVYHDATFLFARKQNSWHKSTDEKATTCYTIYGQRGDLKPSSGKTQTLFSESLKHFMNTFGEN